MKVLIYGISKYDAYGQMFDELDASDYDPCWFQAEVDKRTQEAEEYFGDSWDVEQEYKFFGE